MKIDNCSFPEHLLYDTENFVWISNKEKKIVTIGITVIMASIAGKLSSIKLKPVGTKLEKGKSCGVLESTKYFGVVRTPISGTIVQVNDSLMDKPKLANDFPYAEGWFVKIEPSDMADLKALAKLNEIIEKIPTGEVIHLVSDDPTADLEMLRWSEERGGQSLLEMRNEGNLFHFIVKKVR